MFPLFSDTLLFSMISSGFVTPVIASKKMSLKFLFSTDFSPWIHSFVPTCLLDEQLLSSVHPVPSLVHIPLPPNFCTTPPTLCGAGNLFFITLEVTQMTFFVLTFKRHKLLKDLPSKYLSHSCPLLNSQHHLTSSRL